MWGSKFYKSIFQTKCMSCCQTTSHYPSQTRIDTGPCLHEASMGHNGLTPLPIRHFEKWNCTQHWVRHWLYARQHTITWTTVAQCLSPKGITCCKMLPRLKCMLPCRMLMPPWKSRQCHSATYRKWVLYILLKNGCRNKEVICAMSFCKKPSGNGYSVTGATAGTTAATFPLKWTSQRNSSAHVAL